MLGHNVVKLLLGDLVAYLVHRRHNVRPGDLATAIGVKLAENSLDSALIQKGLDVHSRHHEFGVVDLVVAHIVDLSNDLVNLLVRNVNLTLLHSKSKLRRVDQPGSVFVDFYELLFQHLDLVLVSHFYKHVHCSFLEFADTFERCKSLHDFMAER